MESRAWTLAVTASTRARLLRSILARPSAVRPFGLMSVSWRTCVCSSSEESRRIRQCGGDFKQLALAQISLQRGMHSAVLVVVGSHAPSQAVSCYILSSRRNRCAATRVFGYATACAVYMKFIPFPPRDVLNGAHVERSACHATASRQYPRRRDPPLIPRSAATTARTCRPTSTS